MSQTKTIELPARTAGECTLSDGTVVWVQTLNSLQRDQVHQASEKHALKVCRPYGKGGEENAALRQEARALSPEEQARAIAEHEVWMGRLQDAARKEIADPQEIERGEMSNELYIAAYAQWEADCDAAADKRRDRVEGLYAAKKQEALTLSGRKRLDACVATAIEKAFTNAYLEQHSLETLRRAVRREEDHSAFYFRNTQEVEDASDADRKTLLDKYREFEVSPGSIPT